VKRLDGNAKKFIVRAGGARRIICAHLRCAIYNDGRFQRFHLWLPSVRIFDAQPVTFSRLSAVVWW
jgi:hypothetical protein